MSKADRVREWAQRQPKRVRFQSGSCIVCGQGTDTMLAFYGEAEWHMAALQVLGVPEDEVDATYRSGTGSDPGKVPAGEFTVEIRVCAECVSKSKFHPRVKPVLALPFQEIQAITYNG